jgi:excisionase family DNA binding protein
MHHRVPQGIRTDDISSLGDNGHVYLTVQEVADRLHVHAKTVYGYIRSGELEAIDVGGGQQAQYRIDEEVLKRWIATRKTKRKP